MRDVAPTGSMICESCSELEFTKRYNDIAPRQDQDGIGIRVQVARRQADGSWLRIIDRPEAACPSPFR
jgi:hypothetical protein